MSTKAGVLHIVATPIGNLEDMSPRAVRLLREADLVLAEDTRTSNHLLQHFGIQRRVSAYHDHNERERCDAIIDKLLAGLHVALISDAGTPLISDPGFRLVRAAHVAGVTVETVPGPSAALAALSVSGLATDRFCFEGFVPTRSGERAKFFQDLADEPRTMVFFEVPHRLLDSLDAMLAVFGPDRPASLSRELTKRFEQTASSTLGGLRQAVADDAIVCRGEMVLVVAGLREPGPKSKENVDRWLSILMRHLSPSQAAAAVAELTQLPRKQLYERGLQLRNDDGSLG